MFEFLARYILSIVLWCLARDKTLTFHGLIIDPSYLFALRPDPTIGKVSTKSNWVWQKFNPSRKSGYWKTSFWFWRVKIDTSCVLDFSLSLTLLKTSVNSSLISWKSFEVIPFKAKAFWWYFPVIVPIAILFAASY